MPDYQNYVPELKNNRIRNAARTTVVNCINVIIVVFFPFYIRTLMIYSFGDIYAGIYSVLFSVISTLDMAELGLSEVVMFFLFEPMAVGDRERTEHYLNVLKKAYFVIGTVIIVLGIMIVPFMKILIKDTIPADVNLYLIYLIYLLGTAIQYYAFPEIMALANTAQRGDINGIIGIIGNMVTYILQIIAIVVMHSFCFYFVAILLQGIVIVISRFIVKRCFYNQYHPHGTITRNEMALLKKRVFSLLGHQMDVKFISSIDSLVLSAFMGLSIVTMYSNYMLIVTALGMFITAVFKSLTSSIGNALVVETKEDNFVRFKAVLWLNGLIVSWMFGCVLCMYQMFMKIWMGNRLFNFNTVVLFCFYFYVMEIRKTVIIFKNANGMWWDDRFKPYVSMVINLIVDIALVCLIGVNGAIISSICCILLIELPWEGWVLFKNYFQKPVSLYLKTVINFFIFSVVTSVVVYFLCEVLFSSTGIANLFFRGFFCTMVYAVISVIIFKKSEEMKIWIDSIKFLFITE